MKNKLRFDANFPKRVEITYANGKIDVFDEIIDFSTQHLGDDRKECTIDVRITMARFEGRGKNLLEWMAACFLSISDRWLKELEENERPTR